MQVFLIEGMTQNSALVGQPQELLDGASIVTHNSYTKVHIVDINRVDFEEQHRYTVLDNDDRPELFFTFPYDKSTQIKSLKVIIYNQDGTIKEEIKKRKFRDYSSTGNSTLVSDARHLSYEYIVTQLPITVETKVEYESKSTGFIQGWHPVMSYGHAIENSKYHLQWSSNCKPNWKTIQCTQSNIKQYEDANSWSIELKDQPAVEQESLSPAIDDITPRVYVSLDQFMLEGSKGFATNWELFGKWYYKNLLLPQGVLPTHAVSELQTLLVGTKSDLEKAKRIYQFVQDKSRYISVQLGIGGWKPIAASEVHESGYGDCKGLTNYTMALMQKAGIKAYYSIIDAGEEPEEFLEDFARMQGNHVILYLPEIQSQGTWLECTSQTLPFGYVHNSIHDRSALVITDNGGVIKKLPQMGSKDNVQSSNFIIEPVRDYGAIVSIDRVSKGHLINELYHRKSLDEKEDEELIRQKYQDLPNATLLSTSYESLEEGFVYHSVDTLVSDGIYVSSAEEILVKPIFENSFRKVPKRDRKRKTPFEIKDGYSDVDTVRIMIPKGYKVSSVPESDTLSSICGSYNINITIDEEGYIQTTKTLKINKGVYKKEDYTQYRQFIKDILKVEKEKIILVKI